jgi:hypothetical protein
MAATNGKKSATTATTVSSVNNDAAETIEGQAPYTATVEIAGAATLLFHRWSNEAVAEKAAAAKNSAAKKTDNVESYVYRDVAGAICIPGRYLIGSVTDPRNGAAKYRQDPRSPRKSALDLYRAGVVALTELAPIRSVANLEQAATVWDHLDRQRVMVQRNGVTRERPAFLPGWRATFEVQVLTPEYIAPTALLDVLTMAGRLVGIGDYRPTYGRFQIVRFDLGFFGQVPSLVGAE